MLHLLKQTYFRGIFAILGLTQANDVRKVPSRTPPQRLETLDRFLGEWIDSNFKADRAEKVKELLNTVPDSSGGGLGVVRIHDKLLENFDKVDDNGLRNQLKSAIHMIFIILYAE